MGYSDETQMTPVISDYIEREVSGYKNVSDKDISVGGIAPEARAAFNRKPYYNTAGINFKVRPVLR